MQPSTTVVFIAGIGNSGPEHWQYMWHQRVGGVWVEHDSWDEPVRDAWVKDLDQTLATIVGPKVLVAHSLGCTLVTEWAAEHEDPTIEGALLVAVPDPHGPNFPTDAVGFGVEPAPLIFPTVVVTSVDDPYGSPEHSAAVAGAVGGRLVDVGAKGHINASSGLGDWPEGWSLFTGQFGG